MPLLPGATLEQLIQSTGQRFTVERIVQISSQVCRGLQAAHDQGLVHRDLKPSTIFVMTDDTVKIIDFGVVHLADTKSATSIKGTLHYMAPEQLDLRPATALSDIFSLSVVCYEALTGRKPFARKTEGEVVEAIRTYIPPPASEVNAAVNQMVSRTVHKGMAKQPWHRFSSAREFGDTLQRAIRGEPIERFDRAKIQPRIERMKKACAEGDYQFGLEILTELESEGHIDPDMAVLRIQLEQGMRERTIRQLLDSARTRMEEGEYPLALQKIQDVLNIDSTNMDALHLKKQIERQRSEKQIENWMRLVREHLDNRLYSQARQGLQEILKINSTHAKARELIAEIDRTEQQAAKIKEEKQKLYDAALTAYRNGQISTALSKLEHILEINRRSPDSATSDRDAQYQSFYNQIRSERDSARNAYAEGRQQLLDHNFARALEICEEFLQKHPDDPLFQALKIEVEETQRQEQSAAVAELNRRIDSEPDLDKKYEIVKEAVERYPNEQHFKSSLKSVRDRRDLVNSIAGRARQFEEQAQFNDAAGQWDILRNIYPLYPGLDFEVERVSRRREEQIRNERKVRWVEQVDRQFAVGQYAKARDLCEEALQDFPGDSEISRLRSLAEQGIERSVEAGALLERSHELCAQQRYGEALDALRKAEHLDPPNAAIRAALLGALTQSAREVLDKDWRQAEPLIREANEIDGSDPIVRALSSLIDDHKRQDAVNTILIEARTLQAAGEVQAALNRVETGLQTYPNELRLSQLDHTLRAAAAGERRGTVGDSRRDTGEQMPVATTTQMTVTVSADPLTSTAMVRTPAIKHSPPAGMAPRSAKRIPAWWGWSAAAAIVVVATALFLAKPRSSGPQVNSAPAQAPPVSTSGWIPLQIDLPFDINLLSASPLRVSLTIQANVPDGTIYINGIALNKSLINGKRVVALAPGTYRVKVAQTGYQDAPEQEVRIAVEDTHLKPLVFTLAAIPQTAKFSIAGGPAGADVLVDGKRIGNVAAGGGFSAEVGPGSHSLTLRKQAFEDLSFAREFKAGDAMTFNASGMRAFGTLALNISPPAARVSYQHEGDPGVSTGNEQSVPVKAGSYTITAEAEKFKPHTETVVVQPGKVVNVSWNLEPVPAPIQKRLTPSRVFENGSAWSTDQSGWWVHDGKGYSFARSRQGNFIFDILKEEHTTFLKNRARKVLFVADYKDETERILYTIDEHNLTRKVYSQAHSTDDVKVPHHMEAGGAYRISIEITPATVIIRDRNGKVLDSMKRTGVPGKFGFLDQVTLSAAAAP
jgi:serine/threonine-protein kinase